MLSLQARRFADDNARNELGNAVARIHNLALVHDRLQLFTSLVTTVDAASHFQDLCAMLRIAFTSRRLVAYTMQRIDRRRLH